MPRQRFDAGIILFLIHETRRFQADRDGFLRTLADCVETPIQLAQVASIRSYEAFWRNADLTGALRLVDDAIDQLGARPEAGEALDELRAQRASLLTNSGSHVEARVIIDELRTSDVPRVRSIIGNAERLVETAHGDARHIVERLDEFVTAPPTGTDEVGLLAPTCPPGRARQDTGAGGPGRARRSARTRGHRRIER